MIEMLIEVARKKFYEYTPGEAIKLVMDCLEGCTKEQALKIITGEYRLTEVEGGVDFEEATPDFNIQEWADDSISYLKDKGKELLEDLQSVMKQIILKDKIDTVEIGYNSLFDYYFNNNPSGIIDDIETTGKLPDIIRSLCLDCKKFLEEVKPTTVYISEVPCDPWFVVTAERNGDKYITTFTEVSSNESQAVEQCSKVEDLDLPTLFYINREDS